MVRVSLRKDRVGVSPWLTNNFDEMRFLLILTILKSGVGVSPRKVGVGVSPWMTNHFDKERFLNLDNFEERGWSIPSKG